MLERLGCGSVTLVNSGSEALAILAQHRYDTVLMDYMLPDLDGCAVTEALRQQEKTAGAPRVPVIAMTGRAEDDLRDKCLAAGMDGFLSKPFNHQALADALAPFMHAGN